MRVGLLTIMRRETVRLAHRPRTWLVRVALAGVVLAAMVGFIGKATAWDDTAVTSMNMGNDVFKDMTIVVLLLAMLLTPILAADGLGEEESGETLDLLLLTPLRPASLLWGRVGGRSVVLATLLASVAPAGALLTTVGGVGPADVVSLAVVLALVGVSAGAAGGASAVSVRGLALPAMIAGVWEVLCYLMWPILVSGVVRDASSQWDMQDRILSYTTPLQVMDEALTGEQLLSLTAILALPTLLLAVHGVLAFRRRALGSRTVGLQLALSGVATLMGGISLAMLLIEGATDVLQVGLQAWEGAHPWLPVVVSIPLVVGLQLGTTGLLTGLLSARQLWPERQARRSRRVASWPVLWRELRTRAYGSVRTAFAVGVGAWLVLTGILALLDSWADASAVAGVFGLLLAGGLTALLATSSVVDERRAGTLAHLALSPRWAGRVVLAKLTSVVVRVLPVALLSGVFIGAVRQHPDLSLARFLYLEVWLVAMALAMTVLFLAIAARLAPARAWTTNVTLAGLLFILPIVGGTWLPVLEALRSPLMEHPQRRDLALALVVPTTLGPLLLAALMVRWRRWTQRA